MNLKRLLIFFTLLIVCNLSYSQGQDTLLRLKTDNVVDYQNPKKYLLKDVKITGVEAMNQEMMLRAININKGDSIYIPGETISIAINKLWRYGLYSDVKVYMQTSGEDLYLELALKDRPYVSNWNITGATSANKRELLENMKLTRNIQFSEYLILSSIKAIKDFYIKKGFYNVEVTPEVLQDTMKYNDRSYVKVNFAVDKKVRVKVKEINFDGLGIDIKASAVKGQMKNNKEKKLKNIINGSKLKVKELEDDRQSIIEYLQSKGYRNATILSDSILKISDSRVGLKFNIYQGDKYYYRNITWTGNEKYSNEQLGMILGIKSGDLYDGKALNIKLGHSPEAFQKGIPNISGIYQDDGYLRSEVAAIETEVAKDTIDIDIRILEGEQFDINEISIAGNTRTHDKVVRRDLFLRPGEKYSQSLLISSVQRIGALGNFDPASITPNIMPVMGSDNLVDIGFNLEEASTDNFSFSGGFGAGTFVLGVGVSFKNISLRKVFNKGAWRPYPSGDNQVLSLQIQTNGTYYKNFSFSFLEPWLGGNKPNSLSASFYYSTQTNGRTVFDKGTAQFATLGSALRFGTRLSWPDPYFTFTAGINYQHYDLVNWQNFVFKNGISHILALEARLARTSINSPRYPTAGSDLSIMVSATPPYSLLKKKGYYDNPSLTPQQRYKLVEYFKFDLKGKLYQSLTADDKLVFHVGAQFGYLGHYDVNAISPFEGFSVGGSGVGGYNIYGVTYVGLRGYKDGALTPLADYGEQARIFSKYTMELRYPFVNTASTTMFAVLFAEAGNAYSSWREFKPFDLKKSLGVGLRIFLPFVGMFGVDFGYGFDRLPGEVKPSGFQFHFSMGQEF